VREEAAGVVIRAGDMGTQLAVLQESLEQQEASTHSTNAAAHEIAVTSGELRGSMRGMADTAERTRQVVAEGETSLTRLSATMEALLAANRQIVAKLSVINEKASEVKAMADIIRRVAEHTDLLSLNAAIEAEKAGEYGRGFGVVAREIRRLADQSEAAIQDIEAVVRDVRGAIGAGVMEMDTFSGRLVDSVTEAQHIQAQLGDMIQDVQRLLPLLQELDASFRGQDEGVQQIRADMQQLSGRVKATVETLAAAQANRRRVEDAGRRLRALVEQMIAMA
jgi:methyl-accepting chemotaxis protein WspA